MEEKARYKSQELVTKIKDGTITAEDLDLVFYSIQTHAAEQALRMLPNVVDYLIKQSTHIKGLSEDFFKRNKDLVNKKDMLAKLLEQVESENPGLPYEKMLSKVELLAKKTKDLEQTVDVSKKFKISELDAGLGDL